MSAGHSRHRIQPGVCAWEQAFLYGRTPVCSREAVLMKRRSARNLTPSQNLKPLTFLRGTAAALCRASRPPRNRSGGHKPAADREGCRGRSGGERRSRVEGGREGGCALLFHRGLVTCTIPEQQLLDHTQYTLLSAIIGK